jgi:hypothetical protein
MPIADTMNKSVGFPIRELASRDVRLRLFHWTFACLHLQLGEQLSLPGGPIYSAPFDYKK